MKCPKCGENLPNEAVFCGNCGTKMERKIASEVVTKNATADVAMQSAKKAGNKEVGKILEEAIGLIHKAISMIPECETMIENTAEKEENEKLRKKVWECETQVQALKASNEMLKKKVEELEKGSRCSKCGNILTKEMIFCNICGHKVRD